MSFLRTLVFILFAGKVLFAQQIYFCKSVDADGKPVEPKTSWEIKSGTPVAILFENSKAFNSSVVYMFIDRMVGGNYEAYDSKAISAEKTGSKLTYNYSFSESGNYSIYFINNSGERLGQGHIIVRITEKPAVEKAPKVTPDEKIILNAEIIFCEKVINNKPINIKETISAKGGGNITVFVQCAEPFNTNVLVVHIYRKKSSSFEDLIATKKFAVKPSYQKTYFKYKCDAPGEYRFAVYDEFENIIKSASLLVTQ